MLCVNVREPCPPVSLPWFFQVSERKPPIGQSPGIKVSTHLHPTPMALVSLSETRAPRTLKSSHASPTCTPSAVGAGGQGPCPFLTARHPRGLAGTGPCVCAQVGSDVWPSQNHSMAKAHLPSWQVPAVSARGGPSSESGPSWLPTSHQPTAKGIFTTYYILPALSWSSCATGNPLSCLPNIYLSYTWQKAGRGAWLLEP